MKRNFSAWIALAVGLVLTIVASLEVKKVIEQDMANELAFTSDQVTLKIQERLDAYALILKGGAGLFAASNAVDRRAWQAFVEKLRTQDSLPGVQGIGFSQVIPPQQLAAHIARVRAEGFPDYTVRPAGERALYTSIIFLEPFRDRNLRAFGFDMFSEPVRRAAMERARDSGAPALSGKVELVQETGTEVQAGTLMYVPVYRNGAPTDTVEQRRAALIGWSYSPYRMQDLLEGILTQWADHMTKRVHLHIYAGSEVQADSLLYDSHPAVIHKIDPLFYQQRTLDFNGQPWLLAFHPGEGVAPIRYARAWATLAGGIVLSSLLCALMLALARTQARARVIADNLTEELRRSGDLLRESELRWRFALEGAGDGVWDWDVLQSKVFFSLRWKEMLGFSYADIGNGLDEWSKRIHPDDLSRVMADVTAHLDGTTPLYFNEHRVLCKDGSWKWILDRGLAIKRDTSGKALRVVGTHADITERKTHEEQLKQLAHFDTLTGLPNRVLLADRLHQAMTQALRRKTLLAVAFLDLDGFKAINDDYGHKAGDHLLTTLSGSMRQALREGDTLARLGGDEFVAILLDLPDVESSAPLLSRLLAAAAEGVDYEGHALRVSASLGVTFYPQAEAIDADQLLRQADQAMYQAKLAGKNRYHLFDTEQDRNVRGHHESLERIRQALDEREFVLYYQPKVNMRTGVVIGAEALIRWQHPERGLLPPAAFLPLIADHPLAIDIGEWVLDTAMTQIEDWKAAGLPLPVSVNIDAIQLGQADFVDRLRQQLLAHPALAAGDLELEVLETSALADIAQVSSVILACREMGVGFALDDFGTGYSSLTYLKRLPAGLLKIDQSFVRDMLDDPDDLAILNGVLGLASAFRRQTIAEGVETLVHGEILLQLGCELAQGYAIARPMPAEDLPVWRADWRSDPSWLNQAPISRDGLPILFTWVEHRAWTLKVAEFIRGEGDTLPQMDPEQCCVGQWLKADARLRKADRVALQALAPLHIEIHELASELVRLKLNGQTDTAMAQLSELNRLRDRFLAQFVEMLRQWRRAQSS